MLDEGVIVPVEALKDNPTVDEYVPPVVPVKVTGCAAVSEEQKGDPT